MGSSHSKKFHLLISFLLAFTMLGLKVVTPSQYIKNGSFETWVLVVISTVKAAGAKSSLSSYMYPGGVNVFAASRLFSNKLKGKGKEKGEDNDDNDPDHPTLLNTIILN